MKRVIRKGIDMISSMTGFGQACAEIDGVVYSVELRTVNNRYFKSQMRLPEIASFLEGRVEKFVRDQISRGTVSYSLRMKNVSGESMFEVDTHTLGQYVQRLREIASCNGQTETIDLGSMLSLPGIVQPVIPDQEQMQRIQSAIMQVTAEAVDKLKQNRLEEGAALADDLLDNCQKIGDWLDQIHNRRTVVVEEYHARLEKRVDELLARAKLNIDEDMLAREVAIFAERCDIAEEVNRLGTHLQQFSQCCKSKTSVGRKMDFIAQEMLREANTIASKSADAEIAQHVIDIKCAVDRIKEQVQNVE